MKSLRNSSSHLKQGFLLRFVDFSKRSNLYSFSKPEIFYQKSMLSPISFNARLKYSRCLLFLFILKTFASLKLSDQFALLFKFLLRKRPNFYSQKQSQPKKTVRLSQSLKKRFIHFFAVLSTIQKKRMGHIKNYLQVYVGENNKKQFETMFFTMPTILDLFRSLPTTVK